jgi:hypothetical protein
MTPRRAAAELHVSRQLMDQHDLEELVRTWIDLHADPDLVRKSKAREPDDRFWAWQELDGLCRDQPEVAWAIVLAILQRAPPQQVLENLSAGPLEDILAHHGESFIDRVEAEAERSGEFRELLGGVWQNRMSNELWRRVRAACEGT